MITGLINGLFLYKKKITFLNIAFATLLNAVIVSMLINTIALVPIINKAITIFFQVKL